MEAPVTIILNLTDGSEVAVHSDLERWEDAFRAAIAHNAMIEIELPDGSIKPIDPRAVKSFREEPEEALAEAQQELHRAAAG
jgi:hypothetical protein